MRLLAVLVAVICLAGSVPVRGQTAFGFGTTPLSELVVEEEVSREGRTAANLRFERVVSLPAGGQNETDLIVLRNRGGQTADLTGWTLVDNEASQTYTFGESGCEQFASLAPGEKIDLRPQTSDNPCGFAFRINFVDGLNLFDASNNLVAEVSWTESEEGTSFRVLANGQYARVPENLNVIETLEFLGNFSVLLRALDALNLTDELQANNDPDYEGVQIAAVPETPRQLQFPSHFGFVRNRTAELLEPPPAPKEEPPREGIPRRGPYTILAPTDAAFDDLRDRISGAGADPISEGFLLRLPELEDIILYHVIGGQWSSEFLLNNTAIFTSKGVEVVPFVDGLMTEGDIELHDACIDKPTPDTFECFEQVDFKKCFDPFMTNPLGAEWQGGFCERSCGRCTCDARGGTECAKVLLVDVMASNGVIHTIDRVLFPPPRFEKENLAPAAETVLTGPASTGRGRRGDTDVARQPVLNVGFSVLDDEEAETVAALDAENEESDESERSPRPGRGL